MAVLVVGSVALDSVRTPFGERREVLGGSATYFSVAASFFTPVKLVSVVGEDFAAADDPPRRYPADQRCRGTPAFRREQPGQGRADDPRPWPEGAGGQARRVWRHAVQREFGLRRAGVSSGGPRRPDGRGRLLRGGFHRAPRQRAGLE